MKPSHFLRLNKVLGSILLILAPISTRADLVYENIGGTGFVLDTLTDTLWTQDANFSGQGFSSQIDAENWAAALSFPGVDLSGWGLPDSAQFTSLFTQLEPYGAPGVAGNKYGDTVLFGSGASDFVKNVQLYYWTNANINDFNFAYGYPGVAADSSSYSAWAVTTVPAPSAALLFSSAFAALAVFGFPKRNRSVFIQSA